MSTLNLKGIDIEAVIVHLRALGKGDIEPAHGSLGICWNLSEFISDDRGYDIVEFYSSSWPKFSGDKECPIDEPCGIDNLWDNNDRRELCLFLASCLEEDYIEEPKAIQRAEDTMTAKREDKGEI